MADLRYWFGDGDLARRRLEKLAAVFDAPSRALLQAFRLEEASLALDLGCGPGYTTAMPQPSST